MRPISILKFGSSVLGGQRDLPLVVHEIYRELRAGRRVVAVVSARRGSTDRLLANAERLQREPDPEALAAYLATGEAQSVALVTLALHRAGVSAKALDAERVGLVAAGPLTDADPVDVDADALLTHLAETSVVVVPGFCARDGTGRPGRSGRVVVFGRGGSDLTALFLASRIPGARARLVKDVDGVFEHDPAASAPPPRRYSALSFVDALRVGGRIVQPKALRFALEHNVPFDVAALGSSGGTRVGGAVTHLAPQSPPPRALRVALLGLGTVGLGVYRELARRPDLFEARQILVRRAHGRAVARVPRSLLTTSADPSLLDGCDAVVELLGGEEPSRSLIASAIARGLDVVSANKALFALHGRELGEQAARTGARIRFSAAVGGALPMLETVRALGGRVLGFEGVFNSTTNFVLDRLGEGLTLEAAVALAHRHGYCESDPWVDLCGEDAAHKIELLARAAFGDELAPEWTVRRGIDTLRPAEVRAASSRGACVRLIGSCRRFGARIEARLAPREVPQTELFARVSGAGNALVIDTGVEGSIVLTGQGAGRWPTTESVLGDLFELARARTQAETPALAV